jgi:hypothetical protein
VKIDDLLEAAIGSRLLSYNEDLWHVERVEIEQTDAVHRPSEEGGRLNDYLTRTFTATLRHPAIWINRTVDLSGIIAPDRSLLFHRLAWEPPSDKELQWEEMKDERI